MSTFAVPQRLVATPEEADKLLLVDVSNLAHRAFHAYALTTEDGRPSGHVHGSVALLISTLKNVVGPGKVCIVFCYDGYHSSAPRKALLPSYKANRQYSEFNPVAQVKEVLKAIPGLHVDMAEREGDDAIAYMAQRGTQEKFVLSGDKDLWALTRFPLVRVFSPNLKRFVTAEDIVEHFGADHPARIPLAKALYGDPSDGIKGVLRLPRAKINPVINTPGVWLVDDFYRALEQFEITGTTKKKLLEERARVETNYEVVLPDLRGFDEFGPEVTSVDPACRKDLETQLELYECRALLPLIGMLYGASTYVKAVEQ